MRARALGGFTRGALLAAASIVSCSSPTSTATNSPDPAPEPAHGGASAAATNDPPDRGVTPAPDAQGSAGQDALGQAGSPSPSPNDDCDSACIACLMTCGDDCARCQPGRPAPMGSTLPDPAPPVDADGCEFPGPGQPFDGDIVLTTQEEVDAARGYSELSGNLTILGTLGLSVELPNLTRIGGDLRADSTEIERLSLPHLDAIGGELWLYLNQALLEVDLRNLTTVGEQVFIDRNIAVTAAQLFALEEIGGEPATGFVFTGQLALPSCFEERLVELYPGISITAGNGLMCSDCSFSCGGLATNCGSGSFRCGDSTICERGTHYCVSTRTSTPTVGYEYRCAELPEQCVGKASCGCLGLDAMEIPLDDGAVQTCSETDGMVSVSLSSP